MKQTIAAIIVAAGNGSRMHIDYNKLFLKLNNKPILLRTIERFVNFDLFDEIIVTLNKSDFENFKAVIPESLRKKVKLVEGGSNRQLSAYNGLKALNEETDIVLIHDGARPFVSKEVVEDCILKTKENGAAVSALPAADTIKIATEDGFIKQTPLRNQLYQAQTPQGFFYNDILNANKAWLKSPFEATDDASIVERYGLPVSLSMGERNNIKVTTPDDLVLAEVLAKMVDKQEEVNGI